MFKITGTVGTLSATTTWTMTLTDPCPNAQFSLKSNPFANVSYTLRNPELSIPWTVDDLVTNLPVWSCGLLTVTFYNDDAG